LQKGEKKDLERGGHTKPKLIRTVPIGNDLRCSLLLLKNQSSLKRRDSETCHNAKTPKNDWLLPDEKRSIIGFYDQNLSEGYRRLAYMMNDQGVVAASPSNVRRVLLEAGRIRTRDVHKSKKGNGFEQPIRPYQEWHTDISFI
jgi:hypothetical protein